MASVFRRVRWIADGRRVSEAEARRLQAAGERVERRLGRIWYLRYRDATGRMVDSPSSAKTKTAARRLADDAERRAERARRGLEPAPDADGGGTLRALLEWWLQTFSKGTPSHGRNESAIRANLLGSELARLPLSLVTPQRLEAYLQERAADGLLPETLNHLRGFMSRAFNAARRNGALPRGQPRRGGQETPGAEAGAGPPARA